MVQNYSINKRVIVAIAAIANNCSSEDEGGTRADEGGHWTVIINDELIFCLRGEYILAPPSAEIPIASNYGLGSRFYMVHKDVQRLCALSRVHLTDMAPHLSTLFALEAIYLTTTFGWWRSTNWITVKLGLVTEGSMYQHIVSYGPMSSCPFSGVYMYYVIPM